MSLYTLLMSSVPERFLDLQQIEQLVAASVSVPGGSREHFPHAPSNLLKIGCDRPHPSQNKGNPSVAVQLPHAAPQAPDYRWVPAAVPHACTCCTASPTA